MDRRIKMATLVVACAFVSTAALGLTAHAAGGTYTWTGASNDKKFSTAGNWAEGSVPTDGAKLVFTCQTRGDETLTNDTSAKIAEISTIKTGAKSGEQCPEYTIDKVNFQPSVMFSGDVTNPDVFEYDVPKVVITASSGADSLNADGGYVYIPMWDGDDKLMNLSSLSVNTNDLCGYISGSVATSKATTIGAYVSMKVYGSTRGTVTVKKDGTLGAILTSMDNTVPGNIIFEDGSNIGSPATCKGSTGSESSVTTTLSGNITLNGTVTYTIASNVTLKITGNLSGSGKLVPSKESKGVLSIQAASNTSGSQDGNVDTAKEETISLDSVSDAESDYVRLLRLQTGVLNGKRGYISVDSGATLKGQGTIDSLSVSGVVSPGNSPGKITILDSFDIADKGVYEAELLNKDNYDQLIVKGDIQLADGAILNVVYLNGGSIKKGDTFTIVDNQSKNPVQGTFSGLAEGAELTVGGAVFTISYKGGDGNDVVLTAQNDSVGPKVPNTGAKTLATNPVVASIAVLSAIAALGLANQKKLLRKK